MKTPQIPAATPAPMLVPRHLSIAAAQTPTDSARPKPAVNPQESPPARTRAAAAFLRLFVFVHLPTPFAFLICRLRAILNTPLDGENARKRGRRSRSAIKKRKDSCRPPAESVSSG